jgi:hypothetical protein
LINQIIATLNKNDWMSTQETAYCLLALCKYYNANNNNQNVNVVYNINNKGLSTLLIQKKMNKIFLPETVFPKQNTIVLKNTNAIKLYGKIIVKGAPLIGDSSVVKKGLSMSIIYKTMDNQPLNPKQIIQGTDFKAIVTILNLSTTKNLKEMALTQLFPSGWEIHNIRMDDVEVNTTSARYQDIRDDRVYSYYDLPVNSAKTFTIQLNATYLGKFYLPAITSDAMYDNSITASLPGYWVNVVR